MTEIELIDFKGDYTRLLFAGVWEKGERGLYEIWCYAEQAWTDKYSMLPIPLFSEWWERNETD